MQCWPARQSLFRDAEPAAVDIVVEADCVTRSFRSQEDVGFSQLLERPEAIDGGVLVGYAVEKTLGGDVLLLSMQFGE